MNKKVQTITKTVKKETITYSEAQKTIWSALDTLRGRSTIDKTAKLFSIYYSGPT